MQGILLQRRNDIECINDINMDLITVIFTTFDYVTRHPFKGKILCRLNPSVREYLNYLTNLYRQKAAMGENDNNKPGEVIEPDYVLA